MTDPAKAQNDPAVLKPVNFMAQRTDDPQPPRARVFRDWTPPMLKSAEIAAEGGNLSSAVTICEWLFSDDAICGAIDARVEAVIGLTVSFEPGEKESPEVLEATEDDWTDIAPEAELSQILAWGMMLGIAPYRHTTVRDSDTGRVIPTIEFWHPQSLQQDQVTGEWSILDRDGRKHAVDPGGGEWGLHTPYGVNRPWARGLWRSLQRWVLLKQYAQRDWARHSEVAARLFAFSPLDKDGNAPPTSDDQRIQIVNEIKNAGGEFVGALPPGWDVKLLELTANTEQIYKAQIDAGNSAIRIRIRGGDLSSDASGGGSFAAAQSQAQTNEIPKRRADSARLSTTLHDQTLVWYTQWNWGSQALAPWPRWTVPPEDKQVNFNSFALALSALDGLGADFDLDVLRDQFGFTFVTSIDPSRKKESGGGFFGRNTDMAGAIAQAMRAAEAQGEDPAAALGRMFLAQTNAQDQAQSFTDGLGDAAAEQALAASDDLTTALMNAVNQATSSAELNALIQSTFEGYDATALNEITEKAKVLAELAGRFAVLDEL